MDPLLRRIERQITRWGGRLEERATADISAQSATSTLTDVYEAPFTTGLGIDWEHKVVFWDPKYVRTRVDAANVIHEMGHVFATRQPPTKGFDETTFLGWEYALARDLSAVRDWLIASRAYGVRGLLPSLTDDVELGDLDRTTRQELLRACLDRSEGLGLIVAGSAVSIR